MRRNQSNQTSSLDLLLDTICNTFGGVLFISLLVVVLLNMSSRQVVLEPPAASKQAELTQYQERLAQTQDELSRLESALDQHDWLARQISQPGLETLAEKLAAQRGNHVELVKSRNDRLQEIGRSQADVNRIAQELKDLDEAMGRAKENLAAIDQELQQEIQSRTRTANLPTPRTTTKTEIPLFLCEGRLSSYVQLGPDGSLLPNLAECEEKTDASGKLYVEPKPAAGTHVRMSGDAGGDIAGKLSMFDKNQHYLAIFVWPDSFGHFQVVRNVVVRLQFEYRLVPFPADGKVYFGAAPGEATVF